MRGSRRGLAPVQRELSAGERGVARPRDVLDGSGRSRTTASRNAMPIIANASQWKRCSGVSSHR